MWNVPNLSYVFIFSAICLKKNVIHFQFQFYKLYSTLILDRSINLIINQEKSYSNFQFRDFLFNCPRDVNQPQIYLYEYYVNSDLYVSCISRLYIYDFTFFYRAYGKTGTVSHHILLKFGLVSIATFSPHRPNISLNEFKTYNVCSLVIAGKVNKQKIWLYKYSAAKPV